VRAGRASLIEAALATADVAAAALVLEAAAAAIAEAAAEVVAHGRRGGEFARPPISEAAGTRCAEGRPRTSGASAARTWRAVLGFVHPQRATLQRLAVQQTDRLGGGVVVFELDERESARTACLTVGGDLGVEDLAGGAEGFDELLTCDVVAQVANKNLVRNGRLSSKSSSRPLSRRRPTTVPRGAAAGGEGL
jgi:hypothetical protein